MGLWWFCGGGLACLARRRCESALVLADTWVELDVNGDNTTRPELVTPLEVLPEWDRVVWAHISVFRFLRGWGRGGPSIHRRSRSAMGWSDGRRTWVATAWPARPASPSRRAAPSSKSKSAPVAARCGRMEGLPVGTAGWQSQHYFEPLRRLSVCNDNLNLEPSLRE